MGYGNPADGLYFKGGKFYLPFVQFRAGCRDYRGIPPNDLQNRRLLFFELHAFY